MERLGKNATKLLVWLNPSRSNMKSDSQYFLLFKSGVYATVRPFLIEILNCHMGIPKTHFHSLTRSIPTQYSYTWRTLVAGDEQLYWPQCKST